MPQSLTAMRSTLLKNDTLLTFGRDSYFRVSTLEYVTDHNPTIP